MKYIIWGGTGFIGRNLVNYLGEHNEVQVIVQSLERVPKEWFQKKKISVYEEKDIYKIVHADCLFFLAWNGTSGVKRGDIEIQLANLQLTCRAVQLAQQTNCSKFVYAGSIMEYEALEYLNKDNAQPSINYLYSVTKLAADYYAKILLNDLNIDYCNALISNIYGAGEKSQRFVVQMCQKMLNNEQINLTQGTQLYDFIYITDAVRALEKIGKKGKKNTTYYIGNSKQRTLKDYVLMMKEYLNSSSILNFGAVDYVGAFLTYKEFDTNKIYKDLDFSCEVDFKTGIQLTAEWLLKESGK